MQFQNVWNLASDDTLLILCGYSRSWNGRPNKGCWGGVVWKATFHFEMQRSQMGTPKWGAVLLRTCLSGSKVWNYLKIRMRLTVLWTLSSCQRVFLRLRVFVCGLIIPKSGCSSAKNATFFGYIGYIKTSTVFQSSWHGHRVWWCLTHHDATFSNLTDVESRIKQVTKPCALSMPPFAWAVQRMLLAGSRVRTSCWIRWGWAYRFSDWIEMAIAWGDGYHANSFITSRTVDFSLVCYLPLIMDPIFSEVTFS